MSARALQLREGAPPTRDRLTTTMFMAALVHGVIIVGVTFGGGVTRSGAPPGLEVIIVSDDIPEAKRNETAAYLAQRTQMGSGNIREPDEISALRAAAQTARHEGRVDGTTMADEAGALLATADDRVLTTSAPMPEILYFAPPSSLVEMTEVPLMAEGNHERDKLGADSAEEQKVRGPQRDELWVTPDTRKAIVAPYMTAWRNKIESLGSMHYKEALWRAPGVRFPDVEVVILADGTLKTAVLLQSSGSAKVDQAALDILKLASPFDPFPKDLADKYQSLRVTYRWQYEGNLPTRGTVTAPADSQ